MVRSLESPTAIDRAQARPRVADRRQVCGTRGRLDRLAQAGWMALTFHELGDPWEPARSDARRPPGDNQVGVAHREAIFSSPRVVLRSRGPPRRDGHVGCPDVTAVARRLRSTSGAGHGPVDPSAATEPSTTSALPTLTWQSLATPGQKTQPQAELSARANASLACCSNGGEHEPGLPPSGPENFASRPPHDYHTTAAACICCSELNSWLPAPQTRP